MTSNPGCTMQIETGLRRASRTGEVLHLIELARPLLRRRRGRAGARVSGIARAVVTGSSGFVGSHLAARLAAGGCAVTGISNTQPRQPSPDGVTEHLGDVRDADAVTGVIAEARPEVVFPPRRPGVRPRLDARPGRGHRGRT